MKRIIILLVLYLGVNAYAQTDSSVKQKLDSIFAKASTEKDQYKRTRTILSMFVTGVEEFPYLVLYSHEKVYKIAQKNKSKSDEALAWSLAGHGYRLSGDYIKGMQYHNKAVALAEKANDPVVLGFAKTVMAHLYKDRDDNRKAIKLYRQVSETALVGENEKFIVQWAKSNLSGMYLTTNQLDSCLYFAGDNKASLRYIAGAYSKMGRIEEAEKLYHKSIADFKEKRANRVLSTIYLSMAEHFERIRNTDSATFYARQSIAALRSTGFEYLAMKPAKLLTDIYKQTDADSTLKYLKIYSAANDSLYSTRANQQLQMMTFDEDLRQRNIANEKIEYQNKIRTAFLLTGLGVFVVIALILYRNNKQKQQANKVLQSALLDLKATQSQLIQAEKMASLGELTAGIAHEIQNPLNFVNNFSDVSNELIGEILDERQKTKDDRDETLIDEILSDISQNLEKIAHHGRRADGIVKGMLQHSRASSGEKEFTDINALTDEYLRLAYHGLRAKDKSFNADLVTHFDENLPKASVLPQDIGRVLLNLFTNAFYATQQRKRSDGENFKPTVEVRTLLNDNKIEIRVKDNGSGIPREIVDKIFQPFFTTKPTGEGTGLGLSMSYEIVTKGHGGTMDVGTIDGTVFVIGLPVRQTNIGD